MAFILKFVLEAWSVFALITGTLTAFMGAPLWAVFAIACGITCAYAAGLIDEILE